MAIEFMTMEQLNWAFKIFDALTVKELYAILQLRSEVFVKEQQCVYQDMDDKDQSSFHLCAWLNNKLVAYARVIPPGISYDEASIGRVCTASDQRKTGAGRLLMQKAISHTLSEFQVTSIKIGAQSYLEKFYTSLGFSPTGKAYLEDDIPHLEMLFGR